MGFIIVLLLKSKLEMIRIISRLFAAVYSLIIKQKFENVIRASLILCF